MASTQLKINRGTTYTMGFQYQRNGANATLVGHTVRFTVKSEEFDQDADDSDAIILKNITTGNSDGYAEIAINPEDTTLVEPSKYYYDIKVETPTGEIFKMVEGRFLIDGSPTNRQD
jgi:hypothetical protein